MSFLSFNIDEAFNDEMVVVFDHDERYLFASQAVLDTLNMTEKELLGRKVTELFPDIVGTPNYNNIRRAISGEHIHDTLLSRKGIMLEVDYKPVNVDGAERYVVVRAKAVEEK